MMLRSRDRNDAVLCGESDCATLIHRCAADGSLAGGEDCVLDHSARSRLALQNCPPWSVPQKAYDLGNSSYMG